jgi:hypothetical protein
MDPNKVDLKKIWMNQKVNQSNLNELFMKIESLKKSNRKNNIVTSLNLLVTSGIICSIWFLSQPKLVVAKIGFMFIILAIFFFIFSLNKNLFNFSKVYKNENSTIKEYLNYLLNIKEKQKKMQTDIFNSYFLLLNVGILLSMYEFAIKMSFIGSVISYAITIGWLSIVWWYLRPKIIENQNTSIENLIEKLYLLKTQFKTD